MLIFGHDVALAKWAGERIGINDFGPSVAIGVGLNGKIVGAAVYSQFRWPNIEITFVTTTPRWATRSNIRGILRYPFVQLGCKRVTAVTEATNQPARAFLCRLGFNQEGFHPDALKTGAAVTYGLLAKDAEKWIAEESDVQRLTIRTGNA